MPAVKILSVNKPTEVQLPKMRRVYKTAEKLYDMNEICLTFVTV